VSEYIHKSHNVPVSLYHLVSPAKFRRARFDSAVDSVLQNDCLEIEQRYQLKFLEIGTDKDHVHLLIQSVSLYSVRKVVTIIKGIVNLTIEGRNEAASHNPLCAHRVLPNPKRLSTQNPIVDRL